jgi:hypothetical protein
LFEIPVLQNKTLVASPKSLLLAGSFYGQKESAQGTFSGCGSSEESGDEKEDVNMAQKSVEIYTWQT